MEITSPSCVSVIGAFFVKLASFFSRNASRQPDGFTVCFDNGQKRLWRPSADITPFESALFTELIVFAVRGAKCRWSDWAPLARHLRDPNDSRFAQRSVHAAGA